MKKWNSSSHPISDIRNWYENGRLELQPDFQGGLFGVMQLGLC